MTKLAHTKPCGKCPWRRKSAPGWLGADTPEGFAVTTLAETHMPCHSAVDYERDDWEDQLETAPHCAGSLVFLRNTAKLPVDAKLREFRDRVQADHVEVFSHKQQFIDHHNQFRKKADLEAAGIDETPAPRPRIR